MAVTAGLDKAYRNGVFALDAEPAGDATVVATLYDGDTVVLSQHAGGGKGKPAKLRGGIDNVKQWSAETPNLYRLLIEVEDDKGRLISATSRKIGFRTVEIRDGEVQVNGRHVMFKGVNRHDFKDLSGFDFNWTLTEDGREVASGKLAGVHAQAGARGQVPFKLPAIRRNRDTELVLTIRGHAKAGAVPGVAAGQVLGFSQFALASAQRPAAASGGKVIVAQTAEAVTLKSAGASLTVDKKTGLVAEYSAQGKAPAGMVRPRSA